MDTNDGPYAMGQPTPLTVLVAEDDPWVRETICYVLQDAGYAVLDASGGYETLELLNTQPHLVVVLDLLMRHGTGFDVLAAMAMTIS
ncbi:MAG TPA: response regulator [Ktedonobacterales bacterium]|nr:response regulator [Ktedonobacterales bacterium]